MITCLRALCLLLEQCELRGVLLLAHVVRVFGVRVCALRRRSMSGEYANNKLTWRTLLTNNS